MKIIRCFFFNLNQMSVANKFRSVCFIIFLTYLFVHLSIFLLLSFSAGFRQAPTEFKWIEYYKAYLHIGPFFTDSQIQHTNKFAYSLKSEAPHWKEWINPEQNNFESYHKSMGRKISNLRLAGFEKFLAGKIAFDAVQTSVMSDTTISLIPIDNAGLLIMHYYLKDRYWSNQSIDSVRFLMVKHTPLFTAGQQVDTLFYLTYPLDEEI